MSGGSQRTKTKKLRMYDTAAPVAQAPYSRPMYTQHNSGDDNLGLFTNPNLTYVLGRHVIGNIGEVLTTGNERVRGLIRAIAPRGDLGISYAQNIHESDDNGKMNVVDKIIPWDIIKMVCIPNVGLSDCLINELKTDAEIAKELDNNSSPSGQKVFLPFFESSEPDGEILLDEGSFPADEMFKINEKKFSVTTTYNPDLREYTTPVDRSAPNFSELEARCVKLAQDIEEGQSRENFEAEGADDEEKYSAVARTNHANPIAPKASRINQNRANLASRREPYNGVSVSADPVPSVTPKTTETSKTALSIPPADVKIDKVPIPSSQPVVTATEEVPKPAVHVPPADVIITTTAIPLSTEVTAPTTSVTTDRKVKKSTLDPNAPEFHPIGLITPHPAIISHHDQPFINGATLQGLPLSQHFNSALNIATQSNFIPTGQQHAFSYAHQPTHVPPTMSTCPPQNMRGNSLPPNPGQQNFVPAQNHPANLPTQLNQPGSSLMSNPQSVFTNHASGARILPCPSSSIGFTNQRPSDPLAVYSTAYQLPPFQSPYVFPPPQHSGAIPLIVPGPQLFLPGSVSSSSVMVGGMHPVQASSHPMYPGHAIVQVQPSESMPPPSTTPQPSSQSQHQIFQHFQDLPHQMQVQTLANITSAYQPNLMLATQHGAPAAYYPSTQAMFINAGAVHQSVAAGLLPNVPQSNQHALASMTNSIDPSLIASQQAQQTNQFQQPNCQLQHYPSMAPYLQSQQLAATQQMGNQHIPLNIQFPAFLSSLSSAGGPSQVH